MQLIVLIHGMWGRASDFNYIVDQLKHRGYVQYALKEKELPEETANLSSAQGIVYCVTSNEGYFTYDGIDICGLRVANEVCAVLSRLHLHDAKISELSVVGYSMGGLMARYAIGILDSRRVFGADGYAGHKHIRPRIFVTTCSPHVGVNILGPSVGARIFNFIGSWSMARTSRQAFLQDRDQPYQTPLFLYMTQPLTVWTRALNAFERRVLYANIVNDRRCEFYTASASTKDPYANRNLHQLKGPFVPGYEPVVLLNDEPRFNDPIDKGGNDDHGKRGQKKLGWLTRFGTWLFRKSRRLGALAYLTLRVFVVLPLWFCAFLINVGYQSIASKLRTRKSTLSVEVQDLLNLSAEHMVEDMYSTVKPETTRNDTTELSITPVMRRIVGHFDELGFDKFYLTILTTPMAHAAAIMKLNKPEFYEGKPAVQHLIQTLVA